MWTDEPSHPTTPFDLPTLRARVTELRHRQTALADAADYLKAHDIYDHLPEAGRLITEIRAHAAGVAREMRYLGADDEAAATAEGWITVDGRFPDDTDCARCGGNATPNDLFTLPRVWINTVTRIPMRPDGTAIEPGEPGTVYTPLCAGCAHTAAAMLAIALPEQIMGELWPRANWDAVRSARREQNQADFPASLDL